MNGVVITIKHRYHTDKPEIVSPILCSLEDICDFVKKECENGTFDDDAHYNGEFELKDDYLDKNTYRIVIGLHESESRANCRIERFAKSSSLKEAAEAILEATPESWHLIISVLEKEL